MGLSHMGLNTYSNIHSWEQNAFDKTIAKPNRGIRI